MGAWERDASGEGDDPAPAGQTFEELRTEVAPSGLREGIVASWRRSLAHGVSRDVLTPPYDERALAPDSLLVRAADPVLEQLGSDLAQTASCLALADHRGRILRRVTSDPRFDDVLDDVSIAPGFNYSERYVGTNALGTSLHNRTLVAVHAREHFNDRLTGLSCFAAPVRDPLTGRLLGAVGLGTEAGTATGAAEAPYAALVRQAGLLVENRLFDLHTDGQSELYGRYLAVLRQGRDQVFLLASDVLRAPPAVMQSLGILAHEELWALAVDALAHRPEAQVTVTLADGAAVGVRLRGVEHHGRLVGALGELLPTDPTESPARAVGPVLPLKEYAGWSVQTRWVAVALRRLAEERHPVCVAGEVGTGKASMVELVAARAFPGRGLMSLDAAEAGDADAVERVARHLASGSPVLLRRVDELGSQRLAGLLDGVHEAPGRGWLAATWRGEPDAAGTVARSTGLRVLTLPPLRSRPDDVPRAVERMLRSHPEGAQVTFTQALLERLRREPWPTNLAGLHKAVDELLVRRTGPVVDVAELGEVVQATVRRRMTPVEWMLRAAIVDALRNHGGNKDLAAESLGMSRASIYRKIKSLDIDVEAVIRD